ncbi:BlaI/MecI/CopY family transcriptional regulator [Candidatus Micrarchaeota archaeon]|nr:BlaI/MecI/CopY family transcriptional regulator [Candidatus Micrarchaeota archaeon]
MELHKIDFEKKGLNSLIGKLESDIMDALWDKEKATCREVFDEAGEKNDVAYTTITVTMDRMHSKGLIERKIHKGKGGLIYTYSPKYSRKELSEEVSDKFVSFLKDTFGSSSVAYLRKKLK